MIVSMTDIDPGLPAAARGGRACAAAGYGYGDLRALMSRQTGDEKHDTAATSILDVLWVLYDEVLRVSPETAHDDRRDRFYLSKGHGPMAYYAVLAGTSVPAASAALAGLPHRVLGLGVAVEELRRYGTPADHQAAHGLDAPGLRASIAAFLGAA